MFCQILRDSFADVFQPISIMPAWRTPAVLGLAEAAYAHCEFPASVLEPIHLAILADAIEEAGWRRQGRPGAPAAGPHVRGCWLLDLILSKDR